MSRDQHKRDLTKAFSKAAVTALAEGLGGRVEGIRWHERERREH